MIIWWGKIKDEVFKKFTTVFAAYLIECSVIKPNRTPTVRLGSVMEHNQTYTKIWSIEQN